MTRSIGIMALFFALLWSGAHVAAAEPSRPGEVFRDCPDCPELVVLPAGAFLMGTPPALQIPTEVPAELSPQRIRIERSFAMGRYEVTRGEYAVFARATGRDAALVRCRTWVEEKQGFRDLDIRWDAPYVPANATDRHPASCIDWHDAAAYADWLSAKTGARYRLPSEAEWEYAARAGSRTLRPWGNDANAGCRDANANDRSTVRRYPLGWGKVDCDDGFADVAPVGSLRPNAFGLYDMLGNVWEWAEDCSSLDYIGRPTDQRAWVWDGGCRRRIQRGGGWSTGPERTRPGFHGDGSADDRADFAGFRVVRELGPAGPPRERAHADDGASASAASAPSLASAAAQSPQRVRDCAECPELLRLPPGEFSMGSSADDYEHDLRSGETPAMRVRIRRGFALAVREVTAGEFRAFLAASAHQPRFDCARQGNDLEPARCITPADAERYLAWLSSRSGMTYRLPSESEWEYALRAGTGTARFWSGRDSHEGVSISRACDFGNVKDVTGRDLDSPGPWARCTDGFREAAPIGRFAPNPWGFLDLVGNVRELTADCYTSSYKGRPADERAWRWADCSLRAVRGGSWKSRPFDVRSASRDHVALAAPAGDWQDVGFRVARD
ncbi:MAG: formylglycine-generating enzyme family protein [Gammaproteobacteria bacterium]|nr:formylglycine-generating enzyme family protein [Gammaproteobacteria bacterium]